MSKRYNGHPSYRLWNLAVWFGNDEGLYNLAKDAIRHCRTKDEAAKYIYECLKGMSTPDGANYTVSGIKHAIRGL